MINVNQITSQLARMPDDALKQYATMHKNDPYTMSLAMSEFNRRKQLRAGAQGPQEAQPTVVDQQLSQMGMQPPVPQGPAQAMPEDVGIGTLPQQPMSMAAGGIVSFADTGLVTDPMGSGFLETTAPNVDDGDTRNFLERLFGKPRDPAWKEDLIRKELATSPRPPSTAIYPEEEFRGVKSPPPPALPQVPPSQPRPTRNMGTGAPRAAAPRPATPEVGFAERLNKAMGTNPEEDRFAKRREEITNTAKTGAEEGLAKLKADQDADMALMRKGQEERINKREGELTKSKDTNTGMAFLEAGLAMMQARGPGLAAIAQGAGIGVKQYSAGIDKIKSAQEKLDDARDRMEELRQNQSSMNKREVRTEEKVIRDLVTQGQREALAGGEKAYGIKREDMRAAVTSDVARAEGALDRQNRLEAARVQANATPAQIQLINKLGGGDFQRGYEIYKQEAAVPRLYESYTKMASDPLKGADFQAKYPTFDTYLASSGMLGGKSPGILNMPNAAAGNVLPR